MVDLQCRKRDGETVHQAFARIVENDPTFWRAHAICKSAFNPVTIAVGRTDVQSDAQIAYESLMTKAKELRAAAPYMSIEQAFEKVFTDRANAELAARSLGRRAA